MLRYIFICVFCIACKYPILAKKKNYGLFQKFFLVLYAYQTQLIIFTYYSCKLATLWSQKCYQANTQVPKTLWICLQQIYSSSQHYIQKLDFMVLELRTDKNSVCIPIFTQNIFLCINYLSTGELKGNFSISKLV